MALMISEYNKYLVASLRHRVKLLDLGGSPASRPAEEQGAQT
jgi:hypothetical protein